MTTSLAEIDLSLTDEEIDVLIQECTEEIEDASKKLFTLTIESGTLRKKMRKWKEEKNVLEMLKKRNFNDPLVEIDEKVEVETISTLKERYMNLISRSKILSSTK